MLLPYARNKLWYAVVGTGRCGTVYFAKLLTAAHLPCGHERVFGPAGLEGALTVNANSEVSKIRDLPYYVGESSYMAVPYLDHKILADCTLIHAVRHPVKVILSFHNKLQYFHSSQLNKWEQFICRHIDLSGSPLDKCCQYVVGWNRMIGERKKCYRVRVEDGGADLLRWLGAGEVKLGPSNTFEEWEKRQPPLVRPATVEDVLSSKNGRDVRVLMAEYGYTTSEVTTRSS